MISADTVLFPNNVVNLIADTAIELDPPDLKVYKRPLKASDPNQSVGVYATQWQPNQESLEILGRSTGMEPSLNRYQLTVQAFVKDMDEQRGLARHSILSEMVRTMLYRDESLALGLRSLNTELNGVQKRLRRWWVSSGRYVSNEISGQWLHLSTLEFWIEVETI